MIHSNYSWDEYFITMAYLVSMKSKDPNTRVGAVIVGVNKEIRSTGYNGLPRNIEDHRYRYEDQEYKYLASNHAEENAILHCARNGLSTENCTMYTPWIPCARCTKALIQAGIKEVVYDANFPGNDEMQQHVWQQSVAIAKEMLNEAGILIRSFAGQLIKIDGRYNKKSFELNFK